MSWSRWRASSPTSTRTPPSADFLERVALVADTDQIPDEDEAGGVVTLMTLHTAKGLEFPVVFLTGLEDGIFPHARALGDQPELEEERRLAYVGLTRAEQRLYVSRAMVRSAWGAPQHNPPSRFLDELPTTLIDWKRTESAQTTWAVVVGVEPVRRPGWLHLAASQSTMRRRAASAPPPKPTAGTRPVPSLEPGDRVVHDSFGMGTVVTVEGVADKAVASIDFGSSRRQTPPPPLLPRRKALAAHSPSFAPRVAKNCVPNRQRSRGLTKRGDSTCTKPGGSGHQTWRVGYCQKTAMATLETVRRMMAMKRPGGMTCLLRLIQQSTATIRPTASFTPVLVWSIGSS